MSDWDELIKRRAITDLFNIVRQCNDEIATIVEKYDKQLSNAIDVMVEMTHSSEQYMQMESALFRCKDYFRMAQEKSFEEYMAIAIVSETELVETEFTADIVDQKLCYEYDEGTKLALELIASYSEALKHNVLDSASNDMLDKSDE